MWQLGSERATTHQGQESQEPGKPQSGDPTGDPPSDQTSGKRKKQQDEKDSQWLGDKVGALL